jgi:flagellar biosynthesis component FlhA
VNAAEDRLVKQVLPEMRRRLKVRTGLRVPGVRLRAAGVESGPGGYRILLHEIPRASGHVLPGKRYTHYHGDGLGIRGTQAKDPVDGTSGLWVDERDWPVAAARRWDLMEEYAFMVRHLEAVLVDNLDTFFGLQELHDLIDEVGRTPPSALADRLRLLQVIRALLREQVPLTQPDLVLDTFEQHRALGEDVPAISEHARLALRPWLVDMQAGFDWLDLAPEFEEAVRGGVRAGRDWPFLALEPTLGERLVDAVEGHRPEGGRRIGIVVQDPVLRPFVRRLLEGKLPSVPVLAERELDDGIVITGDPVCARSL